MNTITPGSLQEDASKAVNSSMAPAVVLVPMLNLGHAPEMLELAAMLARDPDFSRDLRPLFLQPLELFAQLNRPLGRHWKLFGQIRHGDQFLSQGPAQSSPKARHTPAQGRGISRSLPQNPGQWC